MGIADRDYHRSPQGGFLSNLTPVVKWLLTSNIAIFLLDYLLIPFVLDSNLDGEKIPKLLDWGAFSIESAIHHFQVWRFISFSENLRSFPANSWLPQYQPRRKWLHRASTSS